MALDMIQVVSGVIYDDAGRILLQKRSKHREFPYHWEVPGGKVEEDETQHEALARELSEELDVVAYADTEEPLLTCVFHPPVARKSYQISVYKAILEAGEAQAIDSEEVRYFTLDEMARLESKVPSMYVIEAYLRTVEGM